MTVSHTVTRQNYAVAGATTICPPTLGVPGWDGAWLPATIRHTTPTPSALPNGGAGSMAAASRTPALTLETDAHGRVAWVKDTKDQLVIAGTHANTLEYTMLLVTRWWSGASNLFLAPGLTAHLVGDTLSIVTGAGNLPITGASSLGTRLGALVIRKAGGKVAAWLDGRKLGEVTVSTPASVTFFALGSQSAGTERLVDARVMLRPLTDAECLAASKDAARVYQVGV